MDTIGPNTLLRAPLPSTKRRAVSSLVNKKARITSRSAGASGFERAIAKAQQSKRRKAQLASKQGPASSGRVPLSEAEIDYLENQIPSQARSATQAACWETLTRGHSVVCAQGDELVELFPDGTRRAIKTLPHKVELPTGEIRV